MATRKQLGVGGAIAAAIALAAGTFVVTRDSTPDATPSSATAPAVVEYSSPEVAFIAGPQLRAGAEPLAAWTDEVAVRRGKYWAERYFASNPDSSDESINGNYYDLALCLYVEHDRTRDPQLLDYARRVADRWWSGPNVQKGNPAVPGDMKPGPRQQSFGGLMLRAMDGRPEMWSYIESYTRANLDVWVMWRVGDAKLYSDLRDLGYAMLYAVQLARILPDAYDVYDNGADAPPTGRVTDGAVRRAKFLADAERAAVDYFGRLQQPDGSWRWDMWDGSITDFEQPFMVGIYLEAAVALHELTAKPDVKASLKTQITRAAEHLMRDTYLTSVIPNQAPLKYRAMQYFYPLSIQAGPHGGGYYADRHLQTANIHAYGYAYLLTGDPKFKAWGDELWDACFVGTDGYRSLLDAQSHTKEYTMERRSAGRYLAYRLAGEPSPTPQPSPSPSPSASPSPTPTTTPSPSPTATPGPLPTPSPSPSPTPSPTPAPCVPYLAGSANWLTLGQSAREYRVESKCRVKFGLRQQQEGAPVVSISPRSDSLSVLVTPRVAGQAVLTACVTNSHCDEIVLKVRK